jgi:hypothetical protein
VVTDKQVREQSPSETEPATYLPAIGIHYRIDDRDYHAETYDVTQTYSTDRAAVEALVDQFEVGKKYTCWYDPLDPHRAVLVRGYSGWLYLLLLIPVSFIAIGTGGLIITFLNWNTSAEWRAVRERRAAEVDLFEVGTSDRNFPTVPANANQTNSPGTTLAYRLPIATTTNWRLFAAGLAAFLWNGIVAIFAILAVRSHTRGEPDWMLTAFVVPIAIGGMGLIAYFVRQFLITTGVGPTRIEISDHPLVPGKTYDILLTQAGRLTMNSLEVWLACDEKATYHQGTDTRTETCRVYQERCFHQEDFQIHQGLPFEQRCQIEVPATAMHSFHANHNEVSWKLVVKGNVVGWRDYQRVFQIVVNPATNGITEHDRTAHQAQA